MKLNDNSAKLRHQTPSNVIPILIYFGMTIGMYLLVVSQFSLGMAQCPVDAFDAVPDASIIGMLISLLPIAGCGYIALDRYGRLVPVSGTQTFVSAPRVVTSLQFYALMLGGLGLIAVIWLNGVDSYSCITPRGIIARSGLFNEEHATAWSKAERVIAKCTINNKDDWKSGGLDVYFGNPVPVFILLNSAGKMHLVPEALKGGGFIYTVSRTVTPGICPDELFSFFQIWRP